MQNPLVRRLVGRERLNSTTYTKVMRWNSRVGLTSFLFRLAGKSPESVIQDVDLPISRCVEFLDFLLREVGVLPIWICPIRAYDPKAVFPLYRVDPQTLFVNFGFWDVVKDPVKREPGHYNRKIERKVAEMGGVKSLYSDSYYPEDEFWRLYDKAAYDALKARYDPKARFKNLYEKCVLRR
jgi:FAD/FMN-containing dehydrogenase